MFKNQNTVLLIFYKILSLFGFMETDKNLNSNFNGYFYWLFTVFNLIIVNLHVLLQISYLIWNSESSIDFQEQFFFAIICTVCGLKLNSATIKTKNIRSNRKLLTDPLFNPVSKKEIQVLERRDNKIG